MPDSMMYALSALLCLCYVNKNFHSMGTQLPIDLEKDLTVILYDLTVFQYFWHHL